MTVLDARVKVTLPDHPKLRKLIRRCGQAGAWNLIRLFLFAAANRPDGDLSGLDTDDIELAADWQGEHGAFVAALVEVRFLAGTEGAYVIHDWSEHNPWASGFDGRRDRARWANLVRHHGTAEARRRMPEYAERIGLGSDDDPSPVLDPPNRSDLGRSRAPPSPSPIPVEQQLPVQEHTPRYESAREGCVGEGSDSGDGLDPTAKPGKPMAEAMAPATALSVALRKAGVNCTPYHPELLAAASDGVTAAELVALASEYPGKPATYLIRAARRQRAEGAAPIQAQARAGPARGRFGGAPTLPERQAAAAAEYLARKARVVNPNGSRHASDGDDAVLAADDGDLRGSLVIDLRTGA